MRDATRNLCAAVAVLLASTTASASPQSNQQQKCINTINKDTIKVLAAQTKLGTGCVKDAVKTGSNAETCINSDPKGKVGGKSAKTSSDQTKQCTAPLPDFAFTGAATANGAAIQAGRDVMHDGFGSPLDAGLYSCDTAPAECLCQRQAIDRVAKIFNATSQIFVKCKKFALAIGHDPVPLGAASAADIEGCITNAGYGISVAADPGSKIADATTQLGDTIAKFCGTTPNDEFAGGLCSGLSNAQRTTCLANRVKCRFCQLVNAADALAVDCATFSGTTCP